MRDDEDDERISGDPNAAIVRSNLSRAMVGTGRGGAATVTPGGRRLPPGQRPVACLPVLDLGVQPNIRPVDWRLSVSGAVEVSTDWDWTTFMAQPQVRLQTDIHCVTKWTVHDVEWEGVPARHLLAVVRPRAGAKAVMLRSHDGYSANLPLDVFAGEDVLLAHTLNGEPLDRAHGGPVRAVVPRLYFWKSAKWLRHITVMEADAPGYWEARGYHNGGDPWKEERYD